MTTTCPVCPREQPDGLLCHACTTLLERELGDVAAIVAELDTALSKQARIGAPGKGGLARERMPINVGAMEAANDLGNTLTTWARDVMGGGFGPTHPCPTKAAVAVLLFHIPAIRRHPAVVELHDEITDAIRRARAVVDRPADRVYLGQCLVPMPDDEGRQITCVEEIYARAEAGEVTCNVCGVTHEVAERRRWMLGRMRDMLFTPAEAARVMGEIGGVTVTDSRIRGYVLRKRLQYRAPVEAKRFRLGDLLDVVMDESERRSA